MNKGFHPRTSFDPDSTSYETTRERLEAAKAEDISSNEETVRVWSKHPHQ